MAAGAFLPVDAATATLEQRTEAFKQIIWLFTGVTILAAIVVWICVPSDEGSAVPTDTSEVTLDGVKEVLKNPAVWLQGLIVVTAYTGYKGMDDLGLFARDAFGFNDVEAAQVTTLAFWVRPFAALGAGLIADKVGGPRTILACFVLIIIADSCVALDC